MRTTLRLDDDVIQAARVLARQQGSSLGAVISALARRALNTPSGPAAMEQQRCNGLPLLPIQHHGAPVDLELVNSLRDELL
ncbi:MAG: CopG family transcriptional regulator [Cyanobium sp.]